jgi:hypothetical protein
MRPSPPRLLARLWKVAAAKPILAVGVVATFGIAAAAITLTYTTTSTLTTSVTPPPVQFAAAGDAGPSTLTNYVTAYAISTNKTYISATVKGVPEATLAVANFTVLQNVDASNSHAVTLTTSQVSNAFVSAYTLEIYNPSNALQATLDLRAASPSATFTIPASEMWHAKLTLTLATGAGVDNVALTNSLTLTTV